MPAFIYRLPTLAILFLSILFAILISAALPEFIDIKDSEHDIRLGMALLSPIGASVGMLIGFLLNQAQTNIQQANALVAAEAGQINNLDRLLLRFGDEHSLDTRSKLKSYAESIIRDEWPELQYERGSNKTHDKWRSVSGGVFSLEPKSPKQVAIYSEILETAEEISESRGSRIDRSSNKLPMIFWFAMLILLVAMCGINFLVTLSQGQDLPLGHIIFPLVFGTLLGLLIIFDQPFKGSNAIKPKSIQRVVDAILNRTE